MAKSPFFDVTLHAKKTKPTETHAKKKTQKGSGFRSCHRNVEKELTTAKHFCERTGSGVSMRWAHLKAAQVIGHIHVLLLSAEVGCGQTSKAPQPSFSYKQQPGARIHPGRVHH